VPAVGRACKSVRQSEVGVNQQVWHRNGSMGRKASKCERKCGCEREHERECEYECTCGTSSTMFMRVTCLHPCLDFLSLVSNSQLAVEPCSASTASPIGILRTERTILVAGPINSTESITMHTVHVWRMCNWG
jgi:hypothetical protein